MKYFNKKILLSLVLISGTTLLADNSGTVKITTRYTDASTGQLSVADSPLINIPSLSSLKNDEIYFSDPGMKKTLCVLQLKQAMEEAVKAYHANHSDATVCSNISSQLLTSVESLHAQCRMLEINDNKLEDAFAMAIKLAENVKKEKSNLILNGHWKPIDVDAVWFVTTLQGNTLTNVGTTGIPAPSPAVYTDITQYNYAAPPTSTITPTQVPTTVMMGSAGMPGPQGPQGPAGLILTAGGAKDFNHLENLINDGEVPQVENFEGFISEFHLPLLNQGVCEKLMCVTPAIAVDAAHKKLFVQVGMNSSTTAGDFKRKPLNLSLVIDVSLSMKDTDGTEKSRLAWAKDAAMRTLEQLNENDIVSIVSFARNASVLVEPSSYASGNKDLIYHKISTLGFDRGTNFEVGLRKGYELVTRNIKPGYENRIILISDAGLNTGTTDDASLLRLVTDYALEKIGLTAIGVGENFNQAFIHKIATTNGGNYVFAQTGKQLTKIFNNFKYLVSPVAYNIAADIDIRGIEAKLAKAYGIPFKEGNQLKELVNIRTLFFSTAEGGGGAMILEYDLA